MSDVEALYNHLHRLEATHKKSKPYPVHKKMDYGGRYNDIYDLIIENLGNTPYHSILDAGCGSGFGTLMLAKIYDAKVTGISISETEIHYANAIAKQLKIPNVFFVKSDFDAISDMYDAIICVESLKHSHDIKKTLRHLFCKLKIGGKLIVVEDFFTGNAVKELNQKFMRDWQLSDLISYHHFDEILPFCNHQIIDLTHYMSRNNKMITKMKHLGIKCLRPLMRPMTFHLLHGGLSLEVMYDLDQMEYGMMVLKKNKNIA